MLSFSFKFLFLLQLFLIIPYTLSQSSLWTLQLLDLTTYPAAQCLDGSPGGYYIQPGIGENASKWVIHIQGGGFCTSIEDCIIRASGFSPYNQTSLGGSGTWARNASCPETTQAPVCVADGGANGWLSSNNTINPEFSTWSKVYLGYCDGASFSGYMVEPLIINSTTSLYFRGKRILEAIVSELVPLTKGATDIIIKGCSAGGVSVFLNADRMAWQFLLHNPMAKVIAAPGAGFLLDLPTYQGNYFFRQLMQDIFNLHNVTGDDDCMQFYTPVGLQYKCFIPQYTLQFIHTPLFMSNSLADLAQQSAVMNISCIPTAPQGKPGACDSDQVAYLNNFREQMILAAQPLLENPQNGVFLLECSIHVIEDDSGSWNSILVQGQTQSETFTAWYYQQPGKAYQVIDSNTWTLNGSTNPTCNLYTAKHRELFV